MSGFSQGGIVRGSGEWVTITLKPGPRREAINPSMFESYADECYLNRNRICIRNDEWHRSVPIPDDRFWVCPAHDRT